VCIPSAGVQAAAMKKRVGKAVVRDQPLSIYDEVRDLMTAIVVFRVVQDEA
jgi:hypothetical protein